MKYSRALKKGEHQLKIFLLNPTEKEVRFADSSFEIETCLSALTRHFSPGRPWLDLLINIMLPCHKIFVSDGWYCTVFN